MKDKVKELLAVLDMTEAGQRKALAKLLQPKPWKCRPICGIGKIVKGKLVRPWKCQKCGKRIALDKVQTHSSWHVGFESYSTEKICSMPDPIKKSLADLAFRLRDERKCMEHWWEGVLPVYQKAQADFIEIHKKYVPEVAEIETGLQWFANFAQPIHWIIAALIARELATDGKTKSNIKD